MSRVVFLVGFERGFVVGFPVYLFFELADVVEVFEEFFEVNAVVLHI